MGRGAQEAGRYHAQGIYGSSLRNIQRTSRRSLPRHSYRLPILCRDKLVGVINVQHREFHIHSNKDIQLISTIGFLVGAEIEMARLEEENWKLSRELQTSKLIEKARGILQRDLHVDEAQAEQALQDQSRQSRKSMKAIAEAILLSDKIKHAPDSPGSS